MEKHIEAHYHVVDMDKLAQNQFETLQPNVIESIDDGTFFIGLEKDGLPRAALLALGDDYHVIEFADQDRKMLYFSEGKLYFYDLHMTDLSDPEVKECNGALEFTKQNQFVDGSITIEEKE